MLKDSKRVFNDVSLWKTSFLPWSNDKLRRDVPQVVLSRDVYSWCRVSSKCFWKIRHRSIRSIGGYTDSSRATCRPPSQLCFRGRNQRNCVRFACVKQMGDSSCTWTTPYKRNLALAEVAKHTILRTSSAELLEVRSFQPRLRQWYLQRALSSGHWMWQRILQSRWLAEFLRGSRKTANRRRSFKLLLTDGLVYEEPCFQNGQTWQVWCLNTVFTKLLIISAIKFIDRFN